MVHAELTVAAVACRGGRFLTVEEIVGGAAVINQPAGHVEAGEAIADAVIRETFEETAWRFIPTGIVGVYYWPHADGRTTLRFAFCGQLEDRDRDREHALDAPVVATRWLAAEELVRCENLRSPLVLQTIDDFARYAPIALERVRHIRA